MDKVINTNCPFTLTEYRSLIQLAKKRFPFIGYAEYKKHKSFILWRHDVEYNIDEMNVLAKIDFEEGIKSTLYVQLHSICYNFWDKENSDIFKKWVSWGHEIGLHFDCGFHENISESNIAGLIEYEKLILEKEFLVKIDSFSFHNPNPEILKFKDNYAGLINAYNDDIFNGDIIYVSDSNGRWREKTIRDVLEDKNVKKVQVNTHDTWWTEQRIPQIQKLENAFRREAEKKIKDYRDNAIITVDSII